MLLRGRRPLISRRNTFRNAAGRDPASRRIRHVASAGGRGEVIDSRSPPNRRRTGAASPAVCIAAEASGSEGARVTRPLSAFSAFLPLLPHLSPLAPLQVRRGPPPCTAVPDSALSRANPVAVVPRRKSAADVPRRIAGPALPSRYPSRTARSRQQCRGELGTSSSIMYMAGGEPLLPSEHLGGR